VVKKFWLLLSVKGKERVMFLGKLIGLVHATLNAVQPMVETFRYYEPSVEVINFLDEGLLRAVNESGEVTPKILRRFIELLGKAEESGVDGILLTCSSFSPAVSIVSPLLSIPLVSVDAAMLEQAIGLGSRIGVIATVAAAGPTTAQQIEKFALRQGKNVKVNVAVVTEAFAKLQSDPVKHDQLIKAEVARLAETEDVVVLAQISMARALGCMSDIKIPILSSPESSIQAIMQKIK